MCFSLRGDVVLERQPSPRCDVLGRMTVGCSGGWRSHRLLGPSSPILQLDRLRLDPKRSWGAIDTRPSRQYNLARRESQIRSPFMAQESVQRRLAAILAADMVGYSRLMGADAAGTVERQKMSRKELIDPTINSHHGRIF